MRSLNNKRGLSSVVGVVLIIFLSAISITLIGLEINKMIQSPSFSPKVNCLEYQSQKVVNIRTVCYSDLNKEIVLSLQRKEGYEVEGISFVYSQGETYKSWICDGKTCGGCKMPEAGSVKNYFLTGIASLPENSKLTVIVDNCEVDSKKIAYC